MKIILSFLPIFIFQLSFAEKRTLPVPRPSIVPYSTAPYSEDYANNSSANLNNKKFKKSAKSAKSEDFDSQLVEGQVYRPDLSVITGDTDSDSFGVIRLRDDFNDHIKNDNGEAIK